MGRKGPPADDQPSCHTPIKIHGHIAKFEIRLERRHSILRKGAIGVAILSRLVVLGLEAFHVPFHSEVIQFILLYWPSFSIGDDQTVGIRGWYIGSRSENHLLVAYYCHRFHAFSHCSRFGSMPLSVNIRGQQTCPYKTKKISFHYNIFKFGIKVQYFIKQAKK